MADIAEFELLIKEQGAREAAAAMGKLEASLKSAQKSATAFDAAKFWKDELAQINKVESAQNRIIAFARRHSGEQQQRRSGGGLGLAAETGIIAGATTAGIELAVEALEKLVHLGVEAVATVGHLAYGFAEASAEAAAFSERSQLAIGFLTHDAPHAGQVFDDVRGEAQKLGLGVDETVDSFKRLLAMQFSVGQSKDLVKLGGDMQSIGADAEHVQRLLYAISEIKGIGTLQQRQVRMLEMAGVSGELINEALAKRLNVTTTEQVKKLQRKGQIDAATAIDAIEEAVMHKVGESKLGQAGETFAATTITGQIGAAKAKARNFMLDIGEAITPVEERLLGKGLSLFDRLLSSPKLGAFGARILGDLNNLADFADQHWNQITAAFDQGVNEIVSGAEWIYDSLKDTALFIANNWDAIVAGTKEVGTNVWNLVAPFVAVGEAVAGLIGWLYRLDDWINRPDAIDKMWDQFDKITGLANLQNAIAPGSYQSNQDAYDQYKFEQQFGSGKAQKRAPNDALSGNFLGLGYGQSGPALAAPKISPPQSADVDALRLIAPGAGNKTTTIGDIYVNVEGVKHDGTPRGAGEDVGAAIRNEVMRMLEAG